MSAHEGATARQPQLESSGLGRRLLRGISALALLALMTGGAYALMLREPYQLPVRVVSVDGEVKRLSPRRLQQTVVDHLNGGILTQDLAELKAAVESLPWIRTASLRRQWPDRLELAVEEHEAIARWGKDGLVTADGFVFRPDAAGFPTGLKMLGGLDEQAPQVVERYHEWAERLAVLQLEIEELKRDPRGAWTLRFTEGFDLALGKARAEERLSRFMRAYPRLADVGFPAMVDMRYSNGLAVRWAEDGPDGRDLSAADAAKSAHLKTGPKGPPRS